MMPSNKIQDLFNVAGMIAVVTGGGSGLGLYAARALDANGAKAIYIVGRRENVLKDAAKTATNGNIIPVSGSYVWYVRVRTEYLLCQVVGDVTDKTSLQAVADRVRKEQGYVNLLFANAGVVGPKPRDYIPSMAKGEKPSIEVRSLSKEWTRRGLTFYSLLGSGIPAGSLETRDFRVQQHGACQCVWGKYLPS